MKFIFNGHVHEDVWRERGSSADFEWSLDLLNYDKEEIPVKGIRLRQSQMDAGEMGVEEYIADWFEKLRAYLGTSAVGFRQQVSASMHDRYKAMLIEAGAEILD